jgi:hypothetical protein
MSSLAKRLRGYRVVTILVAVICIAALEIAYVHNAASINARTVSGYINVEQLSRLEIMRTGRIKLQVVNMDDGRMAGKVSRLRYSLHSPKIKVEDADIRGFVDGNTKYSFNQGTAYHMRVGRRYNGEYKGEFELKRSLIRWSLPKLSRNVRVLSAAMTFWIEAYPSGSPLAKSINYKPLHLYLYPISEDWNAGEGGINRDSFSAPAPGEVSWTAARTGERLWTVPGVLDPGVRIGSGPLPLAMGTITQAGGPVTISGENLLPYLQRCLNTGRTFDLLLKLDDAEEDQWGTETAILTSNFGNERDIVSKRPRLDFDIEIDRPAISLEKDFVLESGMQYELPIMKHKGRRILLAAEVLSAAPGVIPEIWIRGGTLDDPQASEWTPLTFPLERRWDWSQIKLSAAPNRLQLGELFSIQLLETWVQPGPREKQVPEMILIAPSGKLYTSQGRFVAPLSYRIDFQPNELGLWRYGWTFTPIKNSPDGTPPGSHQGEGFFFLDRSISDSTEDKFRGEAKKLISTLQNKKFTEPADQVQFNSFLRSAASYARRGEAERRTGERLIREMRDALPIRFRDLSGETTSERLVRDARMLPDVFAIRRGLQ